MSEIKSSRDKSVFFVLFVEDDYYEGSHDYDYLCRMADKIKYILSDSTRKAKLVIHEYNRNKFIAEPYRYEP